MIAYGILRTAYVQFYRDFGTTPEDAGLGKTELLSQAIVGPVILGLIVLFLSLVLLVGAAFYYRFVNPNPPHSTFYSVGTQAKHLVYVATAIAAIVTVAALFYFANDSADKAIGPGQRVNTRYIGFGEYALPILEVRALPADVEWIGTKGDAPTEIQKAQDCLMLLGQTADRVLLYDSLNGRTVYLPRENVSVEVRTHDSSLNSHCPLHVPTTPWPPVPSG